MQRNSINVIIFDDDEPSVKEHPASKTAISNAQNSKGHHLQIIQQQITYLSDKIKHLEQQADSLSHLKQQNSSICRQSSTSIDLGSGHGQDVVMAVQKKIQIVVRETRKIVDKLGESFQRKLHTSVSKKYQESGIGKIKEQYSSALTNIEHNYRVELDRIQKQYKESEKKMIGRVNTLEERMGKRVKQFETKEKQYVDWIHHLERQLKEKQDNQKKIHQKYSEEREAQERKLQQKQKQNQLRQQQQKDEKYRYEKELHQKEKQIRQKQQQRQLQQRQLKERQTQQKNIQQKQLQQKLQRQKSKSKRMIDVTHAKRQYSQSNTSVLTGDNFDPMNSKQLSSRVNDSKIQKRHRIFDPVTNKSNSVSPQPNDRSLSPISTLTIASSNNAGSSKVINPLTKSKPQQVVRERQNERQTMEKPSLVIEKVTQPMKNNFTEDREQELSPWRQMDKSIQKSPNQLTKRNPVIKDANADQFYKDVPKPNQGWQRFQNYQQNSSSNSDSGSEQDIIFYRNEDKRQSNWPSQKESKWINMDKSSEIQSSQRQSTYQPTIEQKVFSPFDLN